jgi:nitrate/nitrite transport system permease protein
MLLGELGMDYNIWIEWNNLDVSAVIFAIMIIGAVGFAMDFAFGKLSALFNHAEV